MDARALELIRQGDALFSKRSVVVSHWQEAAEQLYPERADFLRSFIPGEEMAAHLTTSIPIIMRRDLGNMFSSMLRPRGLDWFDMTTQHDDGPNSLSQPAKIWLEEKRATQKNAMYDHVSGFDRAAKQSDHDYVTFGQAVLKVEINYRDTAILVRNRHLRDVVWSEDFTGQIARVHEKWKPSAAQLMGNFAPKKLHPEIIKAAETDPDRIFECRHVVMRADEYERIKSLGGVAKNFLMPYVSIYIDVENQHVIEESPSRTLKYIIPRWQTISGSQYSYSQAAIAALPDSRLLQSMTLSLLEASEKYANPPMIAVEEALSGDLNLYANGVTYVSAKYDERLGEVLHPLTQDKGGFATGMQMLEHVRDSLRQAFFLDKINLPVMQPGVTAFEIGQRTTEYIRQALPLFDPVESESSAPICETVFQEMMGAGFFGDPALIPPDLQGQAIKFKFKSPLREAEDERKTRAWSEGLNLMQGAAAFDQSLVTMGDLRKGLRDALKGVGWQEAWTRSDDDMDKMAAQSAQMKQMQSGLAMAGQGADVAQKVAQAALAAKQAQAIS